MISSRATAVQVPCVADSRVDGKRKETIPQFLVLDVYTVQIQVFGTLCINGLNEGHKTSISNIVRFHYPLHLGLTAQFTNKPTRRQSSRGLVNSWTSQLADSELFLDHGNILIYL